MQGLSFIQQAIYIFQEAVGPLEFMTSRQIDSVTISLDGYQTTSIRVAAAKYQQIKLKNTFCFREHSAE